MLMNFHPEQPENEEEAISTLCVCVSAVFSVAVVIRHIYLSIYIVRVCVSVVNMCLASPPGGPGNTDLWQPDFCWATRFRCP